MLTLAGTPSIPRPESPKASPNDPTPFVAAWLGARHREHDLRKCLDTINAGATMLGDAADRGAPLRSYETTVRAVGLCLDDLLVLLAKDARDAEDAAGRALGSAGAIEVGGSTVRGVMVAGLWRVVLSPVDFAPEPADDRPIVAGHACVAIDNETA